MTSTVKVYEIAEDLKMDTETVLHKIRALGIDVKNKMSKIDANYVDQIKSSLAKDKQASFIEVEVAPGVIKRKKVEAPPAPVVPIVTRPAVRAHTPDPTHRASGESRAESRAESRGVSRGDDRSGRDAAESRGEPDHGGGHADEAIPESVEGAHGEHGAHGTHQDVAEGHGHGHPAEVQPAVAHAEPVAPAETVHVHAHARRGVESHPEPGPVAHPEPLVVTAESHPEPPPRVHEATPEVHAEPAVVEARHEPPSVSVPEPTVADALPEARHEPMAEPVVSDENPVVPSERPAPVTAGASVETVTESRPPVDRTDEARTGDATAAARTAARPQGTAASAAAAGSGSGSAGGTGGAAVSAGAVTPTPGVPPLTGAGARSQPPGPRTGIAVWNPQTRQVEYHESQNSRGPGGGTSARPGAGTSTAPTAPKSTLPSRRQVVVPPAPARGPGRPGATRGPMNRPGTTQGAGPRAIPAMRSTSKPVSPSPEMAKHKRVIKIEEQISLQELARRMSLKATDVLMKLLQLGGGGKNINSTLDSDTAKLLASEFGYEVEDVALDVDGIIKASLPPYEEKPEDVAPRSPVVTVMGHVDHGKTTLLDAILGMRVAEGEAGGITQEVRAYRVSTPKGPVVFFDTPGHEAFTALRMRGAQTTDVAVLVVAADDGVMPTTVEAINHAKAARVPIVVALNKMDRPDANPDKVLQQLMQYDVIPEEFGGETLVVRVSAKAKTGIEQLLESLALQTDLLDLKANVRKPGVGTVFEAKLDKGRGAIARVLVQEGIVRNGDVVMAGSAYGRIRAMVDDRGKPVEKAGPSVPVEIQGLNKVPTAGDKLYVVADMRKAQEVAEQLQKLQKVPQTDVKPGINVTAFLDAQRGDRQININVVIKADAQGAVEGLRKALTELSTDKVKVTVIHSAVGAITETDVQLASASGAVILGFNVRPAGKAGPVAEEAKVEIRYYNVIYEAVDDIKALMTGQLKPTLVEKPLGKAEVRQVFNITKVGTIAGCMVIDGLIRRTARARLVRDGAVKWDGKLASLRRFKEDSKEVSTNFECGIGLENYADLKPGDLIEAYEVEEVAAQL